MRSLIRLGWNVADQRSTFVPSAAGNVEIDEVVSGVDIGFDSDGGTLICAVGESGTPYLLAFDPFEDDSPIVHDLELEMGLSDVDECGVAVTADGVGLVGFRSGDEVWLAVASTD